VVLEPMIDSSKLRTYFQRLRFHHGFANSSKKIWVFWKEFVQINIRINAKQFVHLFLHLESNKKACCMFVYATCTRSGHLQLWDSLSAIFASINDVWMVGGDFNVISKISEYLGLSEPNLASMNYFHNFISTSGLRCPYFSKSKYTWARTGVRPCFQRLDMILVNSCGDIFSLAPIRLSIKVVLV
jgi:hypothetical protein